MSELVSISELKVGKRLGLRGAFLVFSEKSGYNLMFQSEASGDKFVVRSQRGDEAKVFKTLDAVKGMVEGAGLSDWPLQVFGDFKLI